MDMQTLLSKTNCQVAEIDGKFYPFQRYGDFQVIDIGGRDAPSNGGHWVAFYTDSGIKYVSSPSPTFKAALSRIRRAFSYCFDEEGSKMECVSLWFWSPLSGYRRLGVFCGDPLFDAQFFARNPRRYPEIEELVLREVLHHLHGWLSGFSDYSDYLAPRVSCSRWCSEVSAFRFFVGSPIGFEISAFVGCRLPGGSIFDRSALCALACSEPLIKQQNME